MAKIEFGVAYAYHMTGAKPKDLTEERYRSYNSAYEASFSYRDVSKPTIYLILDDNYAFDVEPYCVEIAGKKQVCFIKSVKATEYGYDTVQIYFDYFLRDPYKFIEYGERINQREED